MMVRIELHYNANVLLFSFLFPVLAFVGFIKFPGPIREVVLLLVRPPSRSARFCLSFCPG